jgi:hypothetical protein
MKFTKRILAALLTLALALTLTLPAAAAVNWDDFRITTQPQSQTIIHGDSFTLSVEVEAPAGVEVEYQWYLRTRGGGSKPIEGATAKDFYCSSTYIEYPYVNNYDEYYCEISGYEKDTDGTVLSSKVLTSGRARVDAEREVKKLTFWGKIWETIKGIIFVPVFELTMVFIMFVGPFLSAPYLWIKGLFQ